MFSTLKLPETKSAVDYGPEEEEPPEEPPEEPAAAATAATAEEEKGEEKAEEQLGDSAEAETGALRPEPVCMLRISPASFAQYSLHCRGGSGRLHCWSRPPCIAGVAGERRL